MKVRVTSRQVGLILGTRSPHHWSLLEPHTTVYGAPRAVLALPDLGYAHGQESWRALIRELRLAGYDGPLSIKHEDALLSVDEDFIKAATFLHDTVMQEQPARAWWTE